MAVKPTPQTLPPQVMITTMDEPMARPIVLRASLQFAFLGFARCSPFEWISMRGGDDRLYIARQAAYLLP
jgi:hypothetical protein